ncbi:hypothetical protein PoB_006706900 [Plakobranchus ocellatus]|uniref:Uncharacterized protein n=1 Tax=Plakobranchus ocellatus TaxID=259542 RepID=A0AAV4D8P6_9GAST|nr:hypothetical protein PoB_006706900 [Plakobranchus ocellatus]
MKYVAVFFLALFVAAIVDSTDRKRCYRDGHQLLNGTTIDCSSLFNPKVYTGTGTTYCCEDDDREPNFKVFQLDRGSMAFTCDCKTD